MCQKSVWCSIVTGERVVVCDCQWGYSVKMICSQEETEEERQALFDLFGYRRSLAESQATVWRERGGAWRACFVAKA